MLGVHMRRLVFPGRSNANTSRAVEAYNRLGNPGRFQLRAMNRDSFEAVWNGVSSVPAMSGSAGGQVKDLARSGACDSKKASLLICDPIVAQKCLESQWQARSTDMWRGEGRSCEC